VHADFARFFVSGGIAAAIHFAILHFGVSSLGWPGLAATSAGFVVAAAASYMLNYHWTFKSTIPHRQAIPKFLLVAGSGLGINALVFAAMQQGLGAHYLIAQVFATGVVLFWNFVLQRGWSFAGGGAT
jgi:putative flippase GtrA